MVALAAVMVAIMVVVIVCGGSIGSSNGSNSGSGNNGSNRGNNNSGSSNGISCNTNSGNSSNVFATQVSGTILQANPPVTGTRLSNGKPTRRAVTMMGSNDLVVGEDHMLGPSCQRHNWQTGR